MSQDAEEINLGEETAPSPENSPHPKEPNSENSPNPKEPNRDDITIEQLKNRIAELEQNLTSTTSRLEETESILKQCKASPTGTYENKDVQKLTESYRAEIQSLEEKLKCLSSTETAQRVAEENLKLKKRNKILTATNTDFVNKYTNLYAELDAVKNERDDLQKQVASSQSTSIPGPSQCHPGGDIAEVAPSTKVTEQVQRSASQDDSRFAEMKKYLGQYYAIVQKLTLEKVQLQQKLQHNQSIISADEIQIKKLTKQMQRIVQERDKLQADADKMHHGVAQVEEAGRVLRQTSNEEVYAEHYKNLVVELENKNKQLDNELKYKQDHIVDQEAKIEKLTLRCAEAEKDRDACVEGYGNRQSQQTTEKLNSLREEVASKNKELEDMSQIVETYQTKFTELTNEIEQLKTNRNPDTDLYKEQLKAFQEDYMAERQEKQQIIERSRRLREDNEHLMLELQTRSSQSHFSSPPPGPNPSFVEGLDPQSPPIRSHQQPEYPVPSHQPLPPQGTVPNRGVPVYHVPYQHPEYRRANTIPPRSMEAPHGQIPHNYRSDPQFYHAQNYPENPHDTNQVYQSMYGHPNSTISRGPRAPNSGPAQDRRAPR